MLGKRKRAAAVVNPQDQPNRQHIPSEMKHPAKDQDLFRRYFEASFKPLPDIETKASGDLEAEAKERPSSEDESEWEGLSDAEEIESTVQIVEHRANPRASDNQKPERQDYKSFMVS